MPTAPPLIAVYKSNVALSVAPTATGATFKAGDWIFVLGMTADSFHRLGTPTGPPVGTPGWTLLQKKEVSDSTGAYAWYARVTADWTGTISIPIAQQGDTQAIFRAYRFDRRSSGLGASAGADPSANNGSGVLALTITTQYPNSALLWIGGDWFAQAWSGPTFRLPSGSTAAVNDGHGTTDRANWISAHHTDAGPAGAKSVGLTTPTNWRTTIVGVEVLADNVAPSAVSNLQSWLVSENSVSITWGAATDSAGIASYKVYDSGIEIANIPVANERQYTHSGLAPETTHVYTVRAVDTSGNVGGSNLSTTIKMPALRMKWGTENVSFMLGSTPVSEIYLGSDRIWP